MIEPGWYDDPYDTASLRWWDGSVWSGQTAPKRAASAPVTPTSTPKQFTRTKSRPAPELVTDIYAIAPRSASGTGAPRTGLSNRNIFILAGAAVLAMIVGVSGVAAAVSSSGANSVAAIAASPSPEPTASATPKPKSTSTGPTVTYQEVAETEAVPFVRVSRDDPNSNSGTSYIAVPGVDGVLTRTYKVKLENGVEVSRELTGEGVTTAPVDEVTSVGTYVAPPPAPVAAPQGGGCDSNYADACVPIDSDVDCAAGSGNGPSYFGGVARVVGSYIYDLDRDGDGYACEN